MTEVDSVWYLYGVEAVDDEAVFVDLSHSNGSEVSMYHVSKIDDEVGFYALPDDIDEIQEKIRELDSELKFMVSTPLNENGEKHCRVLQRTIDTATAKKIMDILNEYTGNAKYVTGVYSYYRGDLNLNEYDPEYAEEVQSYLESNNISTEFLKTSVDVDKISEESLTTQKYYQVATDVLKATGIRPIETFLESSADTIQGQTIELSGYTDGDANTDGQRTLADAVAILQSLANEDEYGLTSQGLFNADIVGNDGVNADDALEIQRLATQE